MVFAFIWINGIATWPPLLGGIYWIIGFASVSHYDTHIPSNQSNTRRENINNTSFVRMLDTNNPIVKGKITQTRYAPHQLCCNQYYDNLQRKEIHKIVCLAQCLIWPGKDCGCSDMDQMQTLHWLLEKVRSFMDHGENLLMFNYTLW